MQLQNGRPTDTTGRLDKEIRTYDFLDKLGIEYQRIDHEAAFTMEVCEEMEKYLDITPGSVSVMGLMNDHDNAVRLLVDEDVLKGEWVGCHPCINTSSLRIKTKDMFGPVIKDMHHDMTVVKLTGEA